MEKAQNVFKMLVGIIVLMVLFLYPTVNGQSVEFDQECHILATLEQLETRLQDQETLLAQQKTLIEQQGTLLVEQQAHIRELQAQANTSKRAAEDQRIGFTARARADAARSEVIRFTQTVSNEGGGYSSDTGEFTCTIGGLYYFSLNLLKEYLSSVSSVKCRLYRNDGWLNTAYTNPTPAADEGFYAASTSVVIHLSPGDVVYPGNCSPASTIHIWSSFSGFLIRAD